MRIIISPAKKMKADTDTLPWKDLPCFLEQAETLYSKLQGMSRQELQALWQCSDALTARNARQLESTPGLRTGLTPALLAYQGIQYQYMAPGVFTDGEFAYVQEHLRILSGLYGVLRPLDGVVPYSWRCRQGWKRSLEKTFTAIGEACLQTNSIGRRTAW